MDCVHFTLLRPQYLGIYWPDHWDEEEDGIWRPPKVPNPAYKGPWKRKKVKNPNYKGKWKTPWIDNPEFEDDPDLYVLRPTKYVGIEIWQESQRAREEGEKRRRDRDRDRHRDRHRRRYRHDYDGDYHVSFQFILIYPLNLFSLDALRGLIN
ncbi:Calreticulin [Capsicum chinense]|nr:Calreticulin [Capsicum chinense]